MIIPAIDLIDGQVVRLFQGDYSKQTNFEIDPLQQLSLYENQGAKWLHLVDLTGAKDPNKRQLTLINRLTSQLSANIQVGGGVRTKQQVEDLLNSGVKRVVIGSLAVKKPNEVANWLKEFGPESICVALDTNIDLNGNKMLAVSGWQQASNTRIEEIADQLSGADLTHCLVTDISRDGTAKGPNFTLYSELSKHYPCIQWQASGGVGNICDVKHTRSSGATSLIIGKALLENKFTTKEAIQCWQNA
ncbi:1-(5-phosphoribosyl)-5-[(5-phosphoribosylamino)methylideneamino]imidazole-4-carboxamide isomerase [Parashewanella spongiae]|uniref:1-(5-phosphoribosyl)-5-[(5-phosphoribosylamino)methylideneamino] imidazole-4-carboxamide isomerase n=1 Tax=Parashewanella spongiae TaxID=342950 RepID=A0A3A6TSN9_9GAMM|nr:1-(5-phosphoribosyl)-5-[(5-phosphoribosylamino)methylideneamino]imidazole-4-carboxamide isomerase [Parashewanella spongiae]MCL1076829.1 1-(5-phosphoribosyl)-5-[(5-phosphoribosylamino)methylideneamino]imidazole-4-carboxamide isomerase [Parashewanella spongiae]RJY19197.1 1-(5-phosphoribosyl)-5-[(5-phosphoribosylamino)methylideneamino]imidazole-4-carboxamide isomerase [Parashewanella spongiae]